ncbi:MAG: hypothetical protein KBT31_06945, partial [Firmicutes bacterium]|nr:hypothetical protein [Candidatus Colimorpha enterica]
LTKQGNIIEWIERMVYPEGIPDNIQEAIAKTDIDLCKASIEKYISDLAKEHPEIKLIKVYGEEKCEFQFHYEDKRLLCRLPADVTVGNYDETVSFCVNIPY